MTGTVARRPLWRAGWPPVPSLELAASFQIHVLSKAQRLSPDPEHQNLRQPPASHEGTRLLSQDKSPRLAQPRPAPRTCTRAGLRPRRLRPRAFHLVHSSLEEVLLPPPLGSPPTTQLSPTLPCIVRPHPSRSTAALLEFNRGPHLREHFAGNIQFCAGRIPATLLARDSSDISRAT